MDGQPVLGADLNRSEADSGSLYADVTIGIQTMAVVTQSKRCARSALTAANLEKPPGQVLPDPLKYFGGNRCPALPTAGDLANEGAS